VLSHELTKSRAHHDIPGTATAVHGSPSLSLSLSLSLSVAPLARGAVYGLTEQKRGQGSLPAHSTGNSCLQLRVCGTGTGLMILVVGERCVHQRQHAGARRRIPSLSTEPKATPLRNAPTVTVSIQMSLKPRAKCCYTSTIVGETAVQRSTPIRVCLRTPSKRKHAAVSSARAHLRAACAGASVRDKPLPPLYPQGHSHTRTLRSATPFFATNSLPALGDALLSNRARVPRRTDPCSRLPARCEQLGHEHQSVRTNFIKAFIKSCCCQSLNANFSPLGVCVHIHKNTLVRRGSAVIYSDGTAASL
jgi:hypothetical protein